MKKLLFILSLFFSVASNGQMIINPFMVAPAVSYDADAQTIMTRLTTEGVTLSGTDESNINTFVVTAKADNTWSNCRAIYVPIWSDASANAVNWKNPGTYDITWNGSITHASGGATAGGTTSDYGNTGLNANTLTQYDTHMSFYSRTNSATDVYDAGVAPGDSDPRLSFHIKWSDGNLYSDQYTSTGSGRISTSNSNSTGFYINSRPSNTSFFVYKNGSSLVSNSSTHAQSLPNGNIYLFRANGSIYAASARQCSFFSIGDGLTTTEAGALNTNVEWLMDQYGIGVQ